MVAGLVITGACRGAFLDGRNIISLSRFQMLVRTILALSVCGTLAVTRAAEEDPVTALRAIAAGPRAALVRSVM